MYRLNLGFNQRNFNSTRTITAAAINMGTMRGKGSTSRMFNYCTQRSKNPSECINQFVNIQNITPAPEPPLQCDYTFTGTGTLDQATVNANIGTAQKICIQGYTSIGINAFFNITQVTSVTIGTSVTSISESAFDLCTGLTSLIIPNSVQSIAPRAIRRCANLVSVTLPTNPLFTIVSTGVFFNCPKLTSIIIPNSVITIDISSFQGCITLASVTIGTSVQFINAAAFQNCQNLSSIAIPNSVTSIASNAFRGCTALTTVYISNVLASQLGTALGYTWTSPGTIPEGQFYQAPLVVNFVPP